MDREGSSERQNEVLHASSGCAVVATISLIVRKSPCHAMQLPIHHNGMVAYAPKLWRNSIQPEEPENDLS
jgi:hypothetical protein